MADSCRVLTQVPQICSAILTLVTQIPLNFIPLKKKNRTKEKKTA